MLRKMVPDKPPQMLGVRGLTHKQIIKYLVCSMLLTSAWMHGFTIFLFHSDAFHRDSSFDEFGVTSARARRNNDVRGSNVDSNASATTTTTRENVDDSVHPTLYYNNSESTRPVHVVISHCEKPIHWIWTNHLKNLSNWTTTNGERYSIESVTILTKCGEPLTRKDVPKFEAMIPPSSAQQQQRQLRKHGPPTVSVLSLPNVGRCDHSYAYWIRSVLSPEGESSVKHEVIRYNDRVRNGDDHDRDDDLGDPLRRIATTIEKRDLVLFLKDNDNEYRQYDEAIPVPDMLESTLRKDRSENGRDIAKALADSTSFVSGFSCGRVHRQRVQKYRYTSWAHRSITWAFYINAYTRTESDRSRFMCKYWPMGHWIQSLENYTFPNYLDRGFYDYDKNVLQPFPNASEPPGPPVFSGEYLDRAVRPFDSKFEGPPFTTETYVEKDLVPMCYGGVFSTLWGQLAAEDAPVTPHGWRVIADALGRDSNLEEGHYMERWWAELLGWSSYASSSSSSIHATEATTTKTKTETETKARFLTDDEQSILLLYKKLHFVPGKKLPAPLAGLIALSPILMRNTTCCPIRAPPPKAKRSNATAVVAAKR